MFMKFQLLFDKIEMHVKYEWVRMGHCCKSVFLNKDRIGQSVKCSEVTVVTL